MEDDEFNDFQQPVQPQQTALVEDSGKVEPASKEQLPQVENNFYSDDSALINPTNSFAANLLQPLTADIQYKDFEDSSQPQLNKIQSEKLPGSQHVFLDLDQKQPHSDRKIEITGYQNIFFQQKVVLSSGIEPNPKEQLAFQQIENIGIEQQQGITHNQDLKDNVQSNSFAAEAHQQSNELVQNHQNVKQNVLDIEDEDLQKQILENQFQSTVNQQVLTKDEAQMGLQSSHTENQGEIEKTFDQKPSSLQNNEQKQIENQKPELIQDEEQQQFGDFEQTVPNSHQNFVQRQQQNQLDQQKQQQIVEASQPQEPSKLNHKLTKEQQLEQFVNSLPDYSFLFVQAFQSL